jgi:hypothetical protein
LDKVNPQRIHRESHLILLDRHMNHRDRLMNRLGHPRIAKLVDAETLVGAFSWTLRI